MLGELCVNALTGSCVNNYSACVLVTDIENAPTSKPAGEVVAAAAAQKATGAAPPPPPPPPPKGMFAQDSKS